MSSEHDALAEIKRWLAEFEAQSSETPMVTGPTDGPSTPSPATAVPPPSRPPKVGTIIQRSDRENARKAAILTTPPPPPPKRRPPRPYERPPPPVRKETTAPTELLLQPTGPIPAPPIRVEVEPGLTVEVPHFAVHTARRYKARTPQGRWILRFARDGSLRYRRCIQ